MKFSIRDLLLVTVIVAVCTAWWVDRTRLAQVIESQNLKAMRLNDEMARAIADVEAAAVLQPSINSLPSSEQQIARTVAENLSAEKKSGRLKGFSIEIDVQDAKVLLVGSISSEAQRDRVTAIVSRVKGVKQVDNRLQLLNTRPKSAQAVNHEVQPPEPDAILHP
jgi:hypothetical protein